MKVKCPTCKKSVEYEGNPHRPFCSDRCRLIDLGEWASEAYQIPVVSKTPDSESPTQSRTESPEKQAARPETENDET